MADEKVIKVGGQLASVAVDEKLVDAAQVKDASRSNLSQKDINDELYSRTASSSETLKDYVKKTDYTNDKAALDKTIADNKSAADTAIKALKDGKFDKSQLITSDAPLSSTDDSVYTSKKTDALIASSKSEATSGISAAKTELEGKIANKLDKSSVKTEASESASAVYSATYINTQLAGKQNKLTAGTGISISGSTISCTIDTTLYKVVETLPAKPASGDTNKIHLVKASSSATQNVYKEYIWKGDAWEQLGEYKSEVDLSNYVKKSDITSSVNSSETTIPSNKAVKDALSDINRISDFALGHYDTYDAFAAASGKADGRYLIDKSKAGATGSWGYSVSGGEIIEQSEYQYTDSSMFILDKKGRVWQAESGKAWKLLLSIATSDANFTAAEKSKLAGIAEGANKTVVDASLSASSANPVQNKAVQSALAQLQSQIDTINAEKATFTFKRTSGNWAYFVDDAKYFTLQADCSVNASISILEGSNVLKTASGAKTCAYTVSMDPGTSAPTTLTYTAKAVIGKVTKSASVSVYVVNPKYVGAGAAYTDVVKDANKQPVHTSATGTYNVNVAADGQYVFFVLPDSMSISKVTLSGFDFPLNAPDTSSKSGYKIYKSANTYKKGSLTLVVIE